MEKELRQHDLEELKSTSDLFRCAFFPENLFTNYATASFIRT